MHNLRVAATGEEGFIEANGAADIRVERSIDGWVERHGGSRVDDHIKVRRKRRQRTQPAFNHAKPLAHGTLDLVFTNLFAPHSEDRLLEKRAQAILGWSAALLADEQRNLRARMV